MLYQRFFIGCFQPIIDCEEQINFEIKILRSQSSAEKVMECPEAMINLLYRFAAV